MLVIPAIDLVGGRCVRLFQGDYAQSKTYDEDPSARARLWAGQGAALVHVVDLEGARDGERKNRASILAIRAAVDCPLEVGGGIRSFEDAAAYLEAGIERVVLGTAAVRDPGLVRALAARWPGRVVLGADAREGRVSVSGWTTDGGQDVYEFAASFDDCALAGVLFTDVATDGTLQGPNLAAQRRMGERIANPLIASGGVATLADVAALAGSGIPRLAGVVVGTALYEGRFTLEQAVAEAARAR